MMHNRLGRMNAQSAAPAAWPDSLARAAPDQGVEQVGLVVDPEHVGALTVSGPMIRLVWEWSAVTTTKVLRRLRWSSRATFADGGELAGRLDVPVARPLGVVDDRLRAPPANPGCPMWCRHERLLPARGTAPASSPGHRSPRGKGGEVVANL
jgi:hypothetical protein